MAHVSDATQGAGSVGGFEETKPVEDPFAPEHEKFIMKRITDRFMVSRQNRWRFEREWIYLLLMASGNQWVVWTRGRRAYRAKKVPKWHPTPVTNKFTPLGEANVASILQQSPNVQWYPLSKEPADIASADAANRINRLIEVETERRRQAHVRARWQVFTGEAFVESFWDNDIKHGTKFQQWERCRECHSILPPGDISEAGHACPQCGGQEFDPAVEMTGSQCPITGEKYPREMVGEPSPAISMGLEQGASPVSDDGVAMAPPSLPNGDPTKAPPLEPMFGEEALGKHLPIGKIRQVIRSPFEVFYDPTIREFSEQGGLRWAIVIEMISIDVAREQYGADAVATASSHGTQSQALTYMNTLHSLTNGYFSLSGNGNIGSTTTTDTGKQTIRETYYQLPDTRYPDGVMAVRMGGEGGKLVEHKALPYKDTRDKPFIPLVHYPFHRQAGRVAGRTPMSDLARLQDLRNQAEAQMILAERRMTNGVWIIPDGSVKRDPTGEPGELIRYRPLSAAGTRSPRPERIEPQNPASYYQIRMASLDTTMEELAGNFGVASGEAPSGVRAASALAFLAERQQKSVAPQIELTEISDEELARQQMYIFREYGFSEHISLMPGDDNQWTIEKYSNADLTGRFNVRVESGSAMPKSNAQMRSTIEGLHRMGFLDVSNPSTLRHILITFGMRDLMPLIDVDLRDAQRENDRFMALTRGEPVGRPPGHRPGIDNDQVHLAEHVRLAKTDAFIELERTAEKGDQGAQLFVFLWYDHIKQTTQSIQMAVAAQSGSGPGGDGSERPPGRSGGSKEKVFSRQGDEPELETREILEPRAGIG